MKILLFDNYDSFTYNLLDLLRRATSAPVEVRRNDEIELDEVAGFDKILISPGPGLPAASGVLLPMLARFSSQKSILGVCLGQQAIGEAFGGRLRNLERPFHGVATKMSIEDPAEPLFRGMPDGFLAGRYHSWVVEKEGLPDCLRVTARDAEGEVMGLSHRELDVRGVQFHPESILTEHGLRLVKNWLSI